MWSLGAPTFHTRSLIATCPPYQPHIKKLLQSKFERDQDSRELSGWRLSEKSESESRSTVVVKLRVRARRARARAQDRRRTRRERSRTRAAVIGGREGRSFSGSR
ncbi:hypothetical protein QYF36_003453 [Acer negundo]|nr:hypothetical protein QYF36_003453 [Acer negundo]